MQQSTTIRLTLAVCATVNLLAACLLLELVAPAGVSFDFPALHTVHLLSSFIGYVAGVTGLFCLGMAVQREMDRPMLPVAAIGNVVLFAFAAGCWLTGTPAGVGLLLGVIDLAGAALLLCCLAADRMRMPDTRLDASKPEHAAMRVKRSGTSSAGEQGGGPDREPGQEMTHRRARVV